MYAGRNTPEAIQARIKFLDQIAPGSALRVTEWCGAQAPFFEADADGNPTLDALAIGIHWRAEVIAASDQPKINRLMAGDACDDLMIAAFNRNAWTLGHEHPACAEAFARAGLWIRCQLDEWVGEISCRP